MALTIEQMEQKYITELITFWDSDQGLKNIRSWFLDHQDQLGIPYSGTNIFGKFTAWNRKLSAKQLGTNRGNTIFERAYKKVFENLFLKSSYEKVRASINANGENVGGEKKPDQGEQIGDNVIHKQPVLGQDGEGKSPWDDWLSSQSYIDWQEEYRQAIGLEEFEELNEDLKAFFVKNGWKSRFDQIQSKLYQESQRQRKTLDPGPGAGTDTGPDPGVELVNETGGILPLVLMGAFVLLFS